MSGLGKGLGSEADSAVVRFFEPPDDWPRDRFVLGEEFEVGGTHETWGWIIYEKVWEGEGAAARQVLRAWASARTLAELLSKAETKLALT